MVDLLVEVSVDEPDVIVVTTSEVVTADALP